jgi:hypothetical protein
VTIATAATVTEIALHRGMCYGPCPAYTLYVRRSGEAHFEGEHFVDLIGRYVAKIEPADVETLALAVVHLGFDALASHYAVGYTDAQTTTTWLVRGRRRLQVEDYGGAGPQSLRVIDELIDAAAAELDWRPVDEATERNDLPLFAGLDADETWRPTSGQGDRRHWTQAGRTYRTTTDL